MKKKMVFAVAAALLLTASVCFSGCGARAGKLYDAKEEFSVTVQELPGIPTGYSIQFINEWGTANFAPQDGTSGILYYNVCTGKSVMIEETAYAVSGDMLYTCEPMNENGLYNYKVFCGAQYFSSGFSSTKPYTRNGALYTDSFVYYCKPDGTPVEENGALGFVLTAKYTRSGDYYVCYDSGAVYVFDKDGKFLRADDMAKLIPDWNGADVVRWAADGKLFLQYSLTLPDDSEEYTFYSGEKSSNDYGKDKKVKLVTLSYDCGSGKIKTHDDFGFLVRNVYCAEDKYAVLTGSRVTEEKTLSAYMYEVQAYGKDGKVYVDLQELMPGAEIFKVEDGYVFLGTSSKMQIYKGSSLLGEVGGIGEVVYTGSGTVSYGNKQYAPDGTTLRTLSTDAIVLWTGKTGTTYFTKKIGTGLSKLYSMGEDGIERERGANAYEPYDGLWMVQNASSGYDMINVHRDLIIFENIPLLRMAVNVVSSELMNDKDTTVTYTVIEGAVSEGNRYWLMTETLA